MLLLYSNSLIKLRFMWTAYFIVKNVFNPLGPNLVN